MTFIKHSQKSLLKLRFLFRPMFFISLIFHIFFLNLPLPSSPETEEKKAEEIPDKVEITRLIPSPSKPSPKATPKPKKIPPTIQSTTPPKPKPRSFQPPQLKPQPQPQITIPSPTPKITPTPQNSPVKPTPTPTPIPEPKPKETPTLEPSPTPEPKPKETPTLEPSPTKETIDNIENNTEIASETGSSLLEELRPRILKRLEESSNDLEAMEQYIDTLPIQFIRDEHQPYFLNENKQLKLLTIGSLTIPQTSPFGAYFDYIEPVVKEELGFEIIQLEKEYGDSLLYEAKNSSDVTFYMSIVKLKGSGALLVLWPNNPNEVTASE